MLSGEHSWDQPIIEAAQEDLEANESEKTPPSLDWNQKATPEDSYTGLIMP